MNLHKKRVPITCKQQCRVATDTGITGKYLNILEKYFILELYLKNPTFWKKVEKLKNILELYWNFEILILENTGNFLTRLTK